jgi:hypothetical protein
MTGNYSISLRSCTVTIAAEPHKCCSFFIAKIKKKIIHNYAAPALQQNYSMT